MFHSEYMTTFVHPSWHKVLRHVFESKRFRRLCMDINVMYQNDSTCEPPLPFLFKPLEIPFDSINVVILGQDAVKTPLVATGRPFESRTAFHVPDSLKYILEEIRDEYEYDKVRVRVDLQPWVDQGVFLMNSGWFHSKSTSPKIKRRSHWAKTRWLTDAIIEAISTHRPHVVFMLWGNVQQARIPYIKKSYEHLILKAQFPCDKYRSGFMGCGHFKQCNEFLVKHKLPVIEWRL